MLQAPSHLSRVCGHGHIKKFWLMQTQKESQACESKNNVLFSSPSSSRHANRASMKGLDSPQWSSPSPVAPSSGYGDAGAATGKHSSFTCAESLSPPSHFCKVSSPLSPYPTASSGGTEDTDALEDSYVRPDAVDSSGRAPGLDAHPSTSSSRSCSLNVASELECKPYHEPALATSEADPVESLPSEGYHRDDDLLSTSMEDSPVSNADKGHPHHTQHVKGIRPALEGMSADTHTEVEACSSPARHLGTVCTGDKVKWGDGKVSPSHRRMVCSNVLEGVVEKGRHIEATIESRPCDSHCESSPQVTSVGQHPVLKACSLCGTTKTPMWRSGPQGPKSLCNACGIRFKKYRSFPGHSESSDLMVSPLEGSAASKSLARPLKRKQNSLLSTCEPSRPQKMGLKSAVADVVSRQQKKSKWHQLVVKRGQGEFKQELNRDSSSTWNVHTGPASLKKIYGCAPFQSKFKKLAPMDEHRTVSRVFAKDEEEAAVLLMHLSCGLVY